VRPGDRETAAYRRAEGQDAADTALAILGSIGLVLATLAGAGALLWVLCERLETLGWL
jgi:hypothetical protein